MTRTLLLTAGLLALATPAFAQTGYGQPSAGQYRAEQRATAMLNQRASVPDEADADDGWEAGEARLPQRSQQRLDYGRYDGEDDARGHYDDERAAYERDLADNRLARADYRRRSAEHRGDIARWRERVAACNAGVRSACAGYEQRSGSYAGGRYVAPSRGYDERGYASRSEPYPDDDRYSDQRYDAARRGEPRYDYESEEPDQAPYRD